MYVSRFIGLHRQSNCIYIILTMPCVDNISVWNHFDNATDHRLGRTIDLAMGPINTSSLFSLSLTVDAREQHITRVTFRLTITRVADLITVKAKR